MPVAEKIRELDVGTARPGSKHEHDEVAQNQKHLACQLDHDATMEDSSTENLGVGIHVRR